MASSKKEKHDTNSRARRHSGVIVIHGSKKSKKDKDTDTESVSSSDTTVIPEQKKCPLRFIMTGLFEAGTGDIPRSPPGCPLRRVQLWHTIPLVLLAIINLILVIVALLGLAGYRIVIGIQGFIVGFAKKGVNNAYAQSTTDSDNGTVASTID